MTKRDNKKKKVVIVMDGFFLGGAEKQLTRLLAFIDRERLEFELVTLFQLKQKTLYDELPEWLHVTKLNFRSFFDVASLVRLFVVLRKSNPDIVMSSFFFSNTLVRILKPFIGYRVITREHNTYTYKKFSHRVTDWILSFFSRKIVAVSETVAEFTSKQENIPLKKFCVIHNGIDVEESKRKLNSMPDEATIKEKLGFESADRILLNVARLTKQKNHKLLINSFAMFSESYPDYKLVILGDGILMDDLRKQIQELGKEEQILLLGANENVWEYYRVSDYLVSTSEIEGLSNVYLEAMSMGLPVIATKTAGTDILIKDKINGFFIKNSDEESVVESIKLASGADWDHLSKNCLETVRSFDIRHIARKYEYLFLGVPVFECVGMQGSGKTRLTRYVGEKFNVDVVAMEQDWRAQWKKEAFKFVLSHPILGLRVCFVSMKESVSVGRVDLFTHKIYMFLVTASRRAYASRNVCGNPKIVDEGFLQFVLSLYERELDSESLKKVLSWFPNTGHTVFFVKTEEVERDRYKYISSMRRRGGEEYCKRWQMIFRRNLDSLEKILRSENYPVCDCVFGSDSVSLCNNTDLDHYLENVLRLIPRV